MADPPPVPTGSPDGRSEGRAEAAPSRRTDAVGAGLAAMAGHDGEVPELVPAATVIVLRDGEEGPEALMLRRSSSLAFAGGMWVFPGGRIDPADHIPDQGVVPPALADLSPEDLLAAARRAAAREAAEEAGIDVDPDELVWMSHWTPPARPGRRYATWFFVTAIDVADVTVDGGEITDHRWMRPADAHLERDDGLIELSPPTWITLWQLLPHRTAADAVAAFAGADPEHFATRIALVDDEVHALYAGDAGYEDTDAGREGPRHRLRMRGGTWVYERTDTLGG